jgi:hypothetical protein
MHQKQSTMELVERKLTELGLKQSVPDMLAKYGKPLASCKASVELNLHRKESYGDLLQHQQFFPCREDSKKRIKSLRAQEPGPSMPITPVRMVTSCQSTKSILSFKDRLMADYENKIKGLTALQPQPQPQFQPMPREPSREKKEVRMKKSDSTRVQEVSREKSRQFRPEDKSAKVEQYLEEIKRVREGRDTGRVPRPHPADQLDRKRFKTSKKLGKGRFGQVFLA